MSANLICTENRETKKNHFLDFIKCYRYGTDTVHTVHTQYTQYRHSTHSTDYTNTNVKPVQIRKYVCMTKHMFKVQTYSAKLYKHIPNISYVTLSLKDTKCNGNVSAYVGVLVCECVCVVCVCVCVMCVCV